MERLVLPVGAEIVLNVELSKIVYNDIFDNNEMKSIEAGNLVVVRVDSLDTISSRQLSDSKWWSDDYIDHGWDQYIDIDDSDGWQSDPETVDTMPWCAEETMPLFESHRIECQFTTENYR